MGFFDDFAERTKQDQLLGTTGDVEKLFQLGTFDCLMIGIGYKHMAQRKGLFDRFQGQIPFARVVHPSSVIDPSASIGQGVFIYPGVIIDSNVTIGDNVLLNVGVCIAHDSEIGRHSFVSPRASIAGFVAVGDCCLLGINCTVIDNISIPEETQLGGGAVLIDSIAEGGLYVGNPARFVR